MLWKRAGVPVVTSYNAIWFPWDLAKTLFIID